MRGHSACSFCFYPAVCFQKKEPVGDDDTIPEEIKANIDELSQEKLKVSDPVDTGRTVQTKH